MSEIPKTPDGYDTDVGPSSAKYPDPTLAWSIPYDPAVMLIAAAEGCKLRAYKCIAGRPTIFWGETEGHIYPGETGTQAEADATFCRSIARYAAAVRAMCTREPNINQLGALVSLAYNIGLGGPNTKKGLYSSPVLRNFNAGDDDASARSFNLYNQYFDPSAKAYKVARGLTSRRATEAALFLKPIDDAPLSMPQAVAATSSLAASPIAQSSAVTATAGTVTIISSLSDNASTVSDRASALSSAVTALHDAVSTVSTALNISPPMLLGITLVTAGAIAMYWRYKQRQGGHA